MNKLSRKEFIRATSLAAAAFIAGPAFATRSKTPLLSFSTLGSPDWTFSQITDFARQHGYKGIEVRGVQRQMDLPQVPEFRTAESRKATMAVMKEKGLRFVGLGSSANLHHPEGPEREKSMAEAKAFINLAREIKCPYVRVFPNAFPKERSKQQTMELIAKSLVELGDYARANAKKVTVLMETHGEVVWADDLLAIMQSAAHPNVGLVWDVANMWTVTKEPPAAVYQKLKTHIRHTHIKDARLVDGKLQYTLLGQGEVPIFEAIDLLAKDKFKGYYSFEWEKLWHPEIAEPEVALAHYPTAMNNHFKGL